VPTLRTILLMPALSLDERRFDVIDLVLAGLLTGRWVALERTSAAGVGAEAEHAAPEPELRALAEAYRHERGLLAREDLERWLADRALSVADWLGHLRRTLAYGNAPEAAPGDATAVLRADAICSGALRECAQRVIAGAGAAQALGAGGSDDIDHVVRLAHATTASGLDTVDDTVLERSARRVAGLERAHELLADDVAGREAVAARIDANALSWLSFATEELAFGSEDAAREARLCVREDGASLVEVGAQLGVAPLERTRVFAETPNELGARLTAAAAGELVGPVAADGAFVLARLRSKTPPSLGDAGVVARARADLVAEAVGRLSAGRVTWHVAL
jgi:hypothetical protein